MMIHISVRGYLLLRFINNKLIYKQSLMDMLNLHAEISLKIRHGIVFKEQMV